MDDFFLTRLFDWGRHDGGPWMNRANRLLRRLKIPWTIRRALDPRANMTTLEQRLNLWHLAQQPLAYDVPGDFIELGCFDGKTAVILARVLEESGPGRQLHLYDHFQIAFHLPGCDIQEMLLENFRQAGCTPPVVHAGDFRATVPAQLPERIAFAHLDCGCGGDVDQHRATVIHLLEHVYPRMPHGAIGVLMDYRDPARPGAPSHNPGVSLAAQEFFKTRPEKMIGLWAGEYAHGFFRKA